MIQTAIAQTQSALPSSTLPPSLSTGPTYTSLPPTGDIQAYKTQVALTTIGPIRTPTRTSAPTRTPTATVSIEQSRNDFIFIISAALQEGANRGILDIEKVDMVRIANGRLEIEVTTTWASQDNQPIVSHDIVQYTLAVLVTHYTADEAAQLVGSDMFSVYLVTYSTNGDYRYESTTNYDTLVQVKNQTISYDEWVIASNAGFR